jgi:SulP family sulfate permease
MNWSRSVSRAWQTLRALAADSGLQFTTWPATRALCTRDSLRSDLRAALNVALMAFPQGMAYALIAGLPVSFGIYCSAVACLITPWFTSSRLIVPGPTNATAVVVLGALIGLPPQLDRVAVLSLIVLLVGLMLVAAAFLKLANLAQYVSRSVVIGYLAGAACLILANQAQHILGFRIAEATTFLDMCRETVLLAPKTDWHALALGAVTFGLWWSVGKKFPGAPVVFVTLIGASGLAFLLRGVGWNFSMLHSLPIGHWPLSSPHLTAALFAQVLPAALAIAHFVMIEAKFLSKTIASRTGEEVNLNQDLLSLGLANLGCAFTSGMPASISPVRSTLNFTSGARTPVSCLISGLICAVGVLGFGPLIGYVPLPSLAVVVVCTAASLIDWHHIHVALRATRSDGIVLITTFVVALLAPISAAIFIGIAVSIALFLRKAGHTHLVEYVFNEQGQLREAHAPDERMNPRICIVHVEGELFFGAADVFRQHIRLASQDPLIRVVILRLKNARNLDATSVLALEDLIRALRENGRHLLISGATRDTYRVFKNAGLLELLGRENFFLASNENPTQSTKRALVRAQALIGESEAEVKLFYPHDPMI